MNNLRVRYSLPPVAADQRGLLFTAIEARTDPSFDFQEIARVASNAPGIPPDTALLPLANGTYSVRIRCNDGVVFGGYSDVATFTLTDIPPAFREPGVPTGLTLSQE